MVPSGGDQGGRARGVWGVGEGLVSMSLWGADTGHAWGGWWGREAGRAGRGAGPGWDVAIGLTAASWSNGMGWEQVTAKPSLDPA